MKALNFRQREARIFSHVDRDVDAQSKATHLGTAFTGFSEGEIIACAGIIPLWNGVGHAWVTMGANYMNHKNFIHRQVVSYMAKIIAGMELHRVQATVVCDFMPGVLWLERMGFKLEGKLVRYGPDGSDHYTYARIIE